MSRQMKHCIVGELWGKLSHKKKMPWPLEQLADEGNKVICKGHRIQNRERIV